MAEESVTARVGEKASSSSWVVEMEKLIEDTDPSVEMVRWKQHCIYRVPEVIKDRTSSKAYLPQFVSLGPYHHGERHLLPMEEHKRRAMRHMVKRAGKPLWEFVAAIREVADELEAAYAVLDDKWRGANRDSFVEMMVTDGCFLLELTRIQLIIEDRDVDTCYAANDPVFSRRSYLNLWAFMLDDMIAMENQLPLVALQRLLAVQRGTSPIAREINYMVRRLLNGPRFEEGVDNLGLHFLDILHKGYCGTWPHWEGSDKYDPRMPCAVELNEAGIQFKKSNTNSIRDVNFENGVLSMPWFKFHDGTEIILLNLMAFERLHADAKSVVSTYISLVSDIIQSERDVALLGSKGLLMNSTGTDKKVVEIFSVLTKLARTPDKGSKLGYVQWNANAHCRKRRNKWRASFVKTYLSNPWVFISLLAAVILLVSTLLQTVYTIVPFYTKG